MPARADKSSAANHDSDLVPPPVDIDKPRWNQGDFVGRLKHFAFITNPLLLLKSNEELQRTATLVEKAREGGVPRGTTKEQLYAAKVLYDSAYHPDTGERMFCLGRMSAMVPAGTVITGIMLAFYRTTPEVVVAQWINQSFNAGLNFTNRNANSNVTNKQIGFAYASATSAAVGVSVGVNSLVKRAPNIVKRWVPFTAVAAANCINIPLMRQRELIQGVAILDENGNKLGQSQRAAVKGIAQVCLSRIFMAGPPMILVPIAMELLERNPFFRRGRLFSAVMQTLMCSVGYAITVPIGCAIFPQQSSMKTSFLEKSALKEIQARGGPIPDRVYFNKGL